MAEVGRQGQRVPGPGNAIHEANNLTREEARDRRRLLV